MFVYMVHKETGGSTRVPDVEDVIKHHEARGWKVASEPAAEIFVPKTVEPDEDGWVDLWHVASGGSQRLPNNADALQEAFDKGWTTTPPKADGRTETEREADENAAASREAPAPASAKHGKAEKEKE